MSHEGTIDWRTLWAETARRIGDRHRARWICEVASGADRDDFLAALDEPATQRMVAHLDAMVDRVLAGEPLQYVLGQWSFRRIDVMVDPRVLIPRPETELLVEHALTALGHRPRPWRIADLGTGSGVIGLSLAVEAWHEGLEVWLTDASSDALDVARANTAGAGRPAVAVRLAEGSWFDALPADHRGAFDLVVSNPPYIAEGDAAVEPVVHHHEPHAALYAGADGLDHLSVIVDGAPTWLAPGGTLLVEIGSGQGDQVAQLASAAGLVDVTVLADLAGHGRFVQAKRAAT